MTENEAEIDDGEGFVLAASSTPLRQGRHYGAQASGCLSVSDEIKVSTIITASSDEGIHQSI